MFSKNMILPALAGFGVAAAQTNTACSAPTATVASQADASALASCSTLSGDLVIPSTASGVISISGIQQIKGDLSVISAAGLTSLSFPDLGSIAGTWNMTSLTLLSTLSAPDLTSVGSISWEALNALDTLSFGSSISKCDNVLITNTFLSSLEGINLMSVKTLDINNNGRLTTFSTQVSNITGLLNIEANGRSLQVEFPNLETAANMTFRNCSGLSIPSLHTVNGSLGFYGNYFTSLVAPNLTAIGVQGQLNSGSLAIVANNMLTNVSMPALQAIQGAFQIANNTDYYNISFPSVKTVGGAIDFAGNYSTPSIPKLTGVSGGFNMQSTSAIDCSFFDAEKGNGIQGVYTCNGSLADAKSGVGSSTSSSSSSATTSKGAAMSYGVNEAVAGLSVVGGLLSMLL